MREGFDILLRGGVFLVPIVLLSLAGITVLFERLSYLRPATILGSKEQLAKLRDAISGGDLATLESLCKTLATPLGRTLSRGIREVPGSPTEMREAMEGVGRAEFYLMRRRTGAVSATATIAPFLGLLGTVLGMISMFQGVVANAEAQGMTPNVGALADGIWVALLTTAAGLVAAIPLYLGHRYLLGRIAALLDQMESFARELVDAFAVRSKEVSGAEG